MKGNKTSLNFAVDISFIIFTLQGTISSMCACVHASINNNFTLPFHSSGTLNWNAASDLAEERQAY